MPVDSPPVSLAVGATLDIEPPSGGPFTVVYVGNQSPLHLPLKINGTPVSPLQAGNAMACVAVGADPRRPAAIRSVTLEPELYPGQTPPSVGLPSAATLAWYGPREIPPGPATLPLVAAPASPRVLSYSHILTLDGSNDPFPAGVLAIGLVAVFAPPNNTGPVHVDAIANLTAASAPLVPGVGIVLPAGANADTLGALGTSGDYLYLWGA